MSSGPSEAPAKRKKGPGLIYRETDLIFGQIISLLGSVADPIDPVRKRGKYDTY